MVTAFELDVMQQGYGFFQAYDADWAMDWSTRDDGYSGSARMTWTEGDRGSGADDVVAKKYKHSDPNRPRGPGRLSSTLTNLARNNGLAKPSMIRVREGLRIAEKKVGGTQPRQDNATKIAEGSPRWRSAHGKRSHRLEPPHPPRPGVKRHPAEQGWHINWKNGREEGIIPL